MSDERSGRRAPPEPGMADLAEVAVRKLVTAIVIAGGLIALGSGRRTRPAAELPDRRSGRADYRVIPTAARSSPARRARAR